jgi:hypothetical protein
MKLVDITPASVLAEPKWEDVSRAEIGDILVNNRRHVGIVYKKESSCINFCCVNRRGVMHLQSFYKDAKVIFSEDGKQRSFLSPIRYAGDSIVVSDDEYVLANRIYQNAFREKEEAAK